MLSLFPVGLFTYTYVQFSTNMVIKYVQVNIRGSLFFLPDSLCPQFPWLLLFCACDTVQDSWKCKLFKGMLFQTSISRREQAICCVAIRASLL